MSDCATGVVLSHRDTEKPEYDPVPVRSFRMCGSLDRGSEVTMSVSQLRGFALCPRRKRLVL